MQNILNFHIASTNEKLTPRTGVAVFGEYLKGMNFEKLCNTHIPNSIHHKAYDPFEFIYPLILMLHSGGRVLDDIKEIRLDEALKTLLKIDKIPTAGALTKYLHRHGLAGEQGIKNINKSYLKRFLKSIKNQAEIFNYCDKEEILFTVSGQKDQSVMYEIKNLKADSWERLNDKEQIAEFMHTMGKADNAFKMIVIKKDITPILPTIDEYLSEETKAKLHDEIYYTIATNDTELDAKEILKLHRQRGETSENKIKELKNGFNMSYLPTSNFDANSFYFSIGVLAHNLFLLFKQILDKSLQHHTVKTIRYKLYHIAGKVVSHAREITLKVNEQFVQLLQSIREKAYEMSLE